MKRGLIFFMVLVGLALLAIISRTGLSAEITGETITGDLASALSINITVSGPPFLELEKPKNKTYFSNTSLDLEFTSTGADNFLYNLDNNPNITITGSIEFNASYGSHTIYLYANNSEGITWKNITFLVSQTALTLDESEFENERKGATTNFTKFPYDEAQNLSNVTIHDIEYGKIFFNENINVTDDSDFSDSIVNLTANINLSFNRIEINSTSLSNFNKSATLTLYNLTFTTPRILRDGSVCSSSICTQQSYSGGGGTLVFNVTGFSVYTSEETPVAETPGTTSPGGGSSGGSSSSAASGIISKIFPKRGISVSQDEIKVKLKQGQITTEQLTITNNENRKIDFEISASLLENRIILRESKFSLASGESKTISIDLIARESTKPDLYLGKLIVKGGGETKEILVAIEIQSANALLDVRVEIPEEYLQILPGDEIVAEIKLFNFGIAKKSDINIDYMIKGENGNEIVNQHESLAIETQVNFIKRFAIPENAKPGKYFLYVKETYNGDVASASHDFEIVQYKVTGKEKIYIAAVLALVAFLVLMVYFFFSRKSEEQRKIKRKIELKELIR